MSDSGKTICKMMRLLHLYYSAEEGSPFLTVGMLLAAYRFCLRKKNECQ